ncbi:hypothetical protein RIF29_04345 [Crotalaria pallida]|uniref:Uncharacterized protein n=1 Tax=Crotalaria pallida TaxID=3830 RepID=A0AAN9P9S3_CROPI
MMAINLDSAYHLCQLAHPLLKASGKGSIVFISSIAGVVSLCSKKRIIVNSTVWSNITMFLQRHVTVIKTLINLLREISQSGYEMLYRTPLRCIAEAHEVSSLVAFLCLPAASYIIGQLDSTAVLKFWALT